MYLVIVIVLMGAAPVLSIAVDAALGHGGGWVPLIGKWFVFWAVGVRLSLAGARQIAKPAFTAEEIFGIKDQGALVIVQELGFANVSLGLIGLLSLAERNWIPPSALAGGLFYGLAGLKHAMRSGRNHNENAAMVSDIAVCAVLAGFLLASSLGA